MYNSFSKQKPACKLCRFADKYKYRISSNTYWRRLFDFEALRCDTFLRAWFKLNFKTLNKVIHSRITSYFQIFIVCRGCLIITLCIDGGWVLAFLVMLRDGNNGSRGEWYLMKGRNVAVKKVIKSLFVLL